MVRSLAEGRAGGRAKVFAGELARGAGGSGRGAGPYLRDGCESLARRTGLAAGAGQDHGSIPGEREGGKQFERRRRFAMEAGAGEGANAIQRFVYLRSS